MTKADKAELRRLCRAGDKRSDERLAEICDCTVATVRRYRRILGPPLEAQAAKASFEEDHSLQSRSWGKGRHSSIPKSQGAEGRNWAGE